MPRAVEEWIGKTDNTPAPPRVQLRILEKQGRLCALTGAPIPPGVKVHCDHRIPLRDGGRNCESNLQIVMPDAHRKKTAREAKERAKVDAIAKASFGIKSESGPKIQSPVRHPPEPRKSASRPTEKQPAYGQSEIARRYGL